MAPVGHASRHPARWQCLHTSDENSQANLSSVLCFSTKLTWRHVDAPSAPVLSYDMPVKTKPSSGNWFHCLHATSQALQPMHTVVSVKKPFFDGFAAAGPGGIDTDAGRMSGLASTGSVLTRCPPLSPPL